MDRLIVGCGYLGLRAAIAWRDQGLRVAAVTRRSERAADFACLGLHPVVADVTRPDTLSALPEAGCVLYAVGYDRSAKPSMREVYVQGLAHVLAALWETAPPERLIYVSSTSVYGQSDGSWVNEESPTVPATDAGRIVLEAERLLTGIPAVVLRFAGIYGPGRLLRGEALRDGRPIPGDPEHLLNLIHVEDGVAAVVAAANQGRPGAIYNVSDDEPTPRQVFYRHLAGLLGAPPPRFERETAGRRDAADKRVSNRKLRQELGVRLRFPTYREGLAALVAQFGPSTSTS